ncbi:MAG: hypothetical protein KA369_03485 [Spirochaetes bacterium]|nr:hypothetical protein [Spirochaetota bacterium]
MKNNIIIVFLATLSLWLCAGARAEASAISMGQIQTVASDGSLDVLRNPSLLTAQSTDNALGVLFLSTAFSDRRYSYSGATISSTVSRPRYGTSKYLAGSLFLSYSRRTSGGTVGIGIDAGNPFQAMKERNGRNYYGINTSSYAIEYLSAHSDRNSISPRLVISYGLVVSGNHAIGLQWALGYGQAREKDDFVQTYGTTVVGQHWVTKKTEDINAEMSLGYSFKKEGSQAGLMVRSGRFNWERTYLRFGHGDFGKGLVFSGSVRENYYLQYDRGLRIMAGGYQRLGSFFAVALEGAYGIPFSYNYKDVRYDEVTSFYGMSNNMTIRKSGLYSLSAGFEILPSGPATISLGGNLSSTRERRTNGKIKETMNVDTYAGSLGVDIRAIDALLIMVGSSLTYTHRRTGVSSNINYLGSVSIGGLTRALQVDLFLGLSGGF